MAKTPIQVELGTERPASIEQVGLPVDFKNKSGLVTLTERLRKYSPDSAPFLNDSFGGALNQNGAVSGTPILVHDGIDSVLWTGSNIVGTRVTFNSSDQAQAGSNSVKVDVPGAGNVWEFDKGSSQALSSYTAISFYIYIDSNWAPNSADSVEIYGWDGAEVGNRVAIEDYFDETIFNTWLPVNIPLADMGLSSSTITGLRFEFVAKSSKAPTFYIDTLQIEETGGSIVFKASAPKQRPYHVHEFIISFADALAGTVTGGTMPGLAYDQILAETLTNGILITRRDNGTTTFARPFLSLGDFLGIGFEMQTMSDGTNTFVTLSIKFREPLIIYGSKEENYMSISVQDNLTGLLKFSAILRGASEIDPRGITEETVIVD